MGSQMTGRFNHFTAIIDCLEAILSLSMDYFELMSELTLFQYIQVLYGFSSGRPFLLM